MIKFSSSLLVLCLLIPFYAEASKLYIALSVKPVVAREQITITLHGLRKLEQRYIKLAIIDTRGSIVADLTKELRPRLSVGFATIHYDVTAFTKGVYIVSFVGGSERQSKKFMVS